MQKIASGVREIISENIRELRMEKFPGHGGSKKCAAAFGVSQQQWSPWERGSRVPDGIRIEEMAAFFGVPVEYFYERHAALHASPPETVSHSRHVPDFNIPPEIVTHPNGSADRKTPDASTPPSASEDASCPHYRNPVPGQPSVSGLRSKCTIADGIAGSVDEITISIRLKDPDAINLILKECLINANSLK